MSKNLCKRIVITRLFVAAKTRNDLNEYPLTGDWLNKVWHILIRECYAAIRKNAIELKVLMQNAL